MSATMKDVARLAGVSTSTVSRVLANHPAISEETAVRVRDAMQKLKYQPNQIARSLSNRATHTIALIMPDPASYPLMNPFFVNAIRGVTTFARKHGYYLLLTYPENHDELTIIKDLVGSRRIDGIILTSVKKDDAIMTYLEEYEHPYVVIGHPYEDQKTLWVDNDNYGIVYKITKRLIEQGHRKIAFLGGADDYRVTTDRRQGYLDALRDHNIPIDEKIIYREWFSESIAAEITRKILDYCMPDAVIATDDTLALGVERTLSEQHHAHDVAVIGFNNTQVAQYVRPSLSSVEINAELLGFYAAKLLITRLQGKPQHTNHLLIEAEFIERESSRVSRKA
ncbi:MAG: LacI family DNA-binding transcriptional regulator [Eubacteriales bacterium]|nr:LacI family DNA-binding transcriptional regulator [Eubacteriales bacterium]